MRTNVTKPSMMEHLRTARNTEKHKSGKILLIPGSYPDGVAGKDSSYPFLTICEKEPTTKLVEAEIVSDGGALVKRIFLLMQKDEYAKVGDDLWPVVNDDVDRSWQRAFKTYCVPESGEAAPIIFREQVDENNMLQPYRPLFYCRRTQQFFHPPCPECGKPLELCLDDSLLVKNGLQAYSSSLSRFLYCETCVENPDTSAFFAKRRKNGEPSGLKDLKDLVSSYGGLLTKGAGAELPCQDCDKVDECFRNGSSAQACIVAFSFFPFHMMAFEAPSVHAGDFISLLSGASTEEVARRLEFSGALGRKRRVENLPFGKRMFLFEKDQRLFAEILYLKLSFLGEFAKILFKNIHVFKYPDLRISLEGIWVRLDQKNSMLPAFWNFSIVPIDIGGNVPESAFTPKLPPFFSLYGLSVLWFHTLLVNKRIWAAGILEKISEETRRLVANESDTFERHFRDRNEEKFRPENIFYDPQAMVKFVPSSESGEGKMPADWQRIWEETLALGWSLLDSSMAGDRNWSEEEFFNRLDNLRDEVRSRLFSGGLSPVPAEIATSSDRDIARVLSRIAEKWRGKMEATVLGKDEEDVFQLESDEDGGEFELEEMDEDEAETVIIARDKLPFEELRDSRLREETIDSGSGEELEEMPETVFTSLRRSGDSRQDMAGGGRMGDAMAFDAGDSDDFDIGMKMDSMEEEDDSEADTVILPGPLADGEIGMDLNGGSNEEDAGAGAGDDFNIDWEKDDDDDFAETVLLSGDGAESGGTGRYQTPAGFSGEPEDFGAYASKKECEDDDDFMSETVFLSTGKFKIDDSRDFGPTEEDNKKMADEVKENRPGPPSDEDDDDLLETIILDPNGSKDK